MKKLLAGIAVVSILAIGALAFAHGPGWGGGGYMMGPGYGSHMMGQGYGGSYMRGWGGPGQDIDRKFFDETSNLRKDLHNKRFEYFEAARNPKTDPETLTTLEKEIYEIQTKIRGKAPRTASGGYGGYGRCW
jgi:hypothetical protein